MSQNDMQDREERRKREQKAEKKQSLGWGVRENERRGEIKKTMTP